jgi:hypothetical protein
MKSIALFTASLCLGFSVGCVPNHLSDTTLAEMSTVERWASLKTGMSKNKVFRIIGSPQSLRNSKTYTVYTFDCFLCTATFDSLNQLKTWHGPNK